MSRLRLPDIGCYGSYHSDNYGFHTLYVDFGPVTVWFSYTTPVAFQVVGNKQVVAKNRWSRTTGKHLTWIDDGDTLTRVDEATFQEEWDKQVSPLFDDNRYGANGKSAAPQELACNGRLPVVPRKLFPLPKLKINR